MSDSNKDRIIESLKKELARKDSQVARQEIIIDKLMRSKKDMEKRVYAESASKMVIVEIENDPKNSDPTSQSDMVVKRVAPLLLSKVGDDMDGVSIPFHSERTARSRHPHIGNIDTTEATIGQAKLDQTIVFSPSQMLSRTIGPMVAPLTDLLPSRIAFTTSEEESAIRIQKRAERRRERQLHEISGPEQYVVDDPVWGMWTAPPGKNINPFQVLCLSCCPCLVPPYCSKARKGAYRRVFTSLSFIFTVIQILLLLGSFIPRGLAPYSINSMIGPWPDTLNLFQAKNVAEIIRNYQVWRLITPIFLHAGIIHLITNLLLQMRVGPFLEIDWGRLRFFIFYMFSGIYASLCSCVFKPESISVGASGALMGLLGAWLAQIVSEWNQYPRKFTPEMIEKMSEKQRIEVLQEAQSEKSMYLMMVLINIAVIVAFSFTPLIDWAAHIGGLLGGLLLSTGIFTSLRYVKILSFSILIGTSIAMAYLLAVEAIQVSQHLLYFCETQQMVYKSYELTC